MWYLIVLMPDLCTLTYFVFVMLSRLFNAALWSLEVKGLTPWLLFVMFIVNFTFLFGILGQMWYLIYRFLILAVFIALNWSQQSK